MNKKIIASLILSVTMFVGCSENPQVDKNTSQNQSVSEKIDVIEDLNIEKQPEKIKNIYRLYYYDASTDSNYFIDKEVEVNSGAIVKALIQELKHFPENNETSELNENIITLSDNIEVSSAKLDKEANVLKVDFNKNFSEGLGSLGEKALINSIVNTLGYNLKVSNVEITIQGKPFSSGHIVMTKGEAFPVQITNIRELQR